MFRYEFELIESDYKVNIRPTGLILHTYLHYSFLCVYKNLFQNNTINQQFLHIPSEPYPHKQNIGPWKGIRTERLKKRYTYSIMKVFYNSHRLTVENTLAHN